MSFGSEKRATLRGELNVVRLPGGERKNQSARVFNARGEGDFGGLPRSSTLKSDFCPPPSCRVSQCRKFSFSSNALVSHALPLSSFPLCHSTSTMASQDVVSSVTLTEQQIAEAGQLEPPFEHLLRDAKVDNGARSQIVKHSWDTTTQQKVSNDNDNDTLREVPHPSSEGLALQARVSGPWLHKKESVLLVELARWQGAQVQTVGRQIVMQRYLK